MTTPQFLTRVSGGSNPTEWPSTWGMKHRSSPTGYEVYDLWDGTNWYTSSNAHSIKVDTATNIWYDNSSAGSPTDVITNGANLELWENTYVIMTFVKPTTASWIGTGTSGGVGFTGSFYDVTSTHFSWEVTHTSGFTSPQTYELHSMTLTPTFISDVVVGAATGSSNSRTHTWGTPDVIQIRDAYGTIGAEAYLTHATNNQKKVHCNFW